MVAAVGGIPTIHGAYAPAFAGWRCRHVDYSAVAFHRQPSLQRIAFPTVALVFNTPFYARSFEPLPAWCCAHFCVWLFWHFPMHFSGYYYFAFMLYKLVVRLGQDGLDRTLDGGGTTAWLGVLSWLWLGVTLVQHSHLRSPPPPNAHTFPIPTCSSSAYCTPPRMPAVNPQLNVCYNHMPTAPYSDICLPHALPAL